MNLSDEDGSIATTPHLSPPPGVPRAATAVCRLHDPAAAAISPEPVKPWPELQMERLADAEPFPIDVFPESVARYIRSVSGAVNCRPDYVALPVLVTAGAAIGRSV